MPPDADLLPLLQALRAAGDVTVSPRGLAARSGWSHHYLHRAFRRVLGQTPRQYLLRLRLETAARALAATDDAIVDVALASGYASHEAFTRAFARYFGRTPSAYRRAPGLRASPDISACVGLFHVVPASRSRVMPTLSIERRALAPVPILFVQRETARHEIAAAIGEGLGQVMTYAAGTGATIAGRPFTRYVSSGPGLLTIDVGMPVAAIAGGTDAVRAGSLQGGPALVAVHGGEYASLGETYAALERWMKEHGARPAGPPWESYVNDPADLPNAADWRTDVYWPIAE